MKTLFKTYIIEIDKHQPDNVYISKQWNTTDEQPFYYCHKSGRFEMINISVTNDTFRSIRFEHHFDLLTTLSEFDRYGVKYIVQEITNKVVSIEDVTDKFKPKK